MAVSVVMPALEMAQETGKLVAWLKQEGERVSKGEPLMEVETDKAVVEVEAGADGIIAAIRAQPGDVVPVGQTIAWIVAPGERPPEVDEVAPTARTSAPVAADRHTGSAPAAAAHGARAPMSPRARRLAAEAAARDAHGKAEDPPQSTAGPAPVSPQDAVGTLWRVMAERMTTAWTSIPHFFLARELDASELIAWREYLNGAGTTVSHTDLLVALAARALRQHPRLNASWTGNTVHYHDAVHIGIAIAVDQAVVVPVIRDADRLSPAEIAARRRELVERARAGRVRPADLSDGTFTLSNLGMYEIDTFAAIVNPPQAAILAVGRIADRVVVRGGEPTVRPTINVTLSCDHRVVDGARAAEFLRDLAKFAEHAHGLGS